MLNVVVWGESFEEICWFSILERDSIFYVKLVPSVFSRLAAIAMKSCYGSGLLTLPSLKILVSC